jgi:hypothetical protein
MISAAFPVAVNPRHASEKSATTQLSFSLSISTAPFWFVGATHFSLSRLQVVPPADVLRESDVAIRSFAFNIAGDQSDGSKTKKQYFFTIRWELL